MEVYALSDFAGRHFPWTNEVDLVACSASPLACFQMRELKSGWIDVTMLMLLLFIPKCTLACACSKKLRLLAPDPKPL
jgi:hypothetical protein